MSPIGEFFFGRDCTSFRLKARYVCVEFFMGGGGEGGAVTFCFSTGLAFSDYSFQLFLHMKMVKMQGGIIYQTRSTKIFGRAWATMKANRLIFPQYVE
jgi:hypothetical protein